MNGDVKGQTANQNAVIALRPRMTETATTDA